jgi:putative tricarboxylic transport membrane protein
MRTANIIVAAILILFGCYYSYLTLLLPDRNLPNTLGSSFMPWMLVSILFGLSILLMFNAVFKESSETCDYRISTKEGLGIVLLATIIIVYINSLNYLGFLLATPIFLAVLMILTGARGWKQIVLASVLITVGIYLFFQKIFQIILPAGEIL